jgi:nucleoid DNA-binding protein
MFKEIDVFKEIAKKPKFSVQDDLTVKRIYKVWSGFTRFLRSHILNGKNVNSPDFGRFVVRQTAESGNTVNFVPSSRFCNTKYFAYKNSSSISKNESKDKSRDSTVSYSAIAHVCGYDRDTVSNAIKDILWKSFELAKNGKTVTLHLKIGRI